MAGKPGRSGKRKGNKGKVISDLWDAGYNSREIAEKTGYSYGVVVNTLSELGLSDRAITKNYLAISGMGECWEKTCAWFRENVFKKKESPFGDWDTTCKWFRENIFNKRGA